MCDVAVDDYLSTIEFFPECYKTQEMCNNKAVNVFSFLFDSVPNWNKTQKMSYEAVNDCLTALNVIRDWFVKCLKSFMKLYWLRMIYSFFDEDFGKVTFCANEMVILGAGLDNINFDDDNNFDEDNPETIIHVRILSVVVFRFLHLLH